MFFGGLLPSSFFLQVTRHDIKDKKAIGKVSEVYPHLIFHNFSTKVMMVLNNLLNLWNHVPNEFDIDTVPLVMYWNGMQKDGREVAS